MENMEDYQEEADDNDYEMNYFDYGEDENDNLGDGGGDPEGGGGWGRIRLSCHTVVFQLRKVSAFEDDADMQPFVKSGQAKLVKGDALVEDDVRTAWIEANADGVPVDTVLISADRIGGIPKFTLSKGFVINPPHLCTTSLLNLLSVIPHGLPTQPKIVIVTPSAVMADSRKGIPWFL
ncbi:hypothetical protein M407DRAFT_133477 [Tulasnella calospora MUT 4182]|uniref:Uncharacterized protein n=1 Tax=Tulasnella calospora MUT 4182 TaxID=1051891 RepID=A0A0C3QHQ9_9AGAM|nr:hypothetical protein M407DRAFT_133477 [Tulasnella calospora MUT 4182]